MDSRQKNAPTDAEKAAEIARWKASPRTQSDEAKRTQAEYMRMLEARKQPDSDLYVDLRNGKRFKQDGSFR